MAPSAGNLLGQNEFWVFSFILAWALINWPLLTLTVGKTLSDAPIVLIYIAAVWLLIIILLYLFDRGHNGREHNDRGHKD